MFNTKFLEEIWPKLSEYFNEKKWQISVESYAVLCISSEKIEINNCNKYQECAPAEYKQQILFSQHEFNAMQTDDDKICYCCRLLYCFEQHIQERYSAGRHQDLYKLLSFPKELDLLSKGNNIQVIPTRYITEESKGKKTNIESKSKRNFYTRMNLRYMSIHGQVEVKKYPVNIKAINLLKHKELKHSKHALPNRFSSQVFFLDYPLKLLLAGPAKEVIIQETEDNFFNKVVLYSERLRSGFFVISIKGRNLIILHVHPGRQKVKN